MFNKTYYLKKKNKKIYIFKNIYNNIYFLKKFNFMKSLKMAKKDFLHKKHTKKKKTLKRLVKFKFFKNNIKPRFNQKGFSPKKKNIFLNNKKKKRCIFKCKIKYKKKINFSILKLNKKFLKNKNIHKARIKLLKCFIFFKTYKYYNNRQIDKKFFDKNKNTNINIVFIYYYNYFFKKK